MPQKRTMAAASPPGPRVDPFADRRALAVLVALAFLSPGAWLVLTLPPEPVAQFLHLVTAAVWLGAWAWAGARWGCPRGVALAVAGVLAVSAVSLLVNAFPAQQLLHDIYGSMPGVLWLLYPLMFCLAASVRPGPHVRDALAVTAAVGGVLVAVMVVWRWTEGFVTTFGSPAFLVPAFAPLTFIALGLAGASSRHAVRWRVLAAWIAGGLAYAGGGLSALFMLGAGIVVTLAVAPGLLGVPEGAQRAVRAAGYVLLALVCIGVVIAQVPLVGSWAVGVDDAAGAEQTIATRLYLWDAAEQMVAERPLFGYGPGGYRLAAVEFYDPGVFAYTAGVGADPIAFSAPSPHSLLWEILTRLGVAGLVAFAALLAAWALRVRELGREDTEPDARALRAGLVIGFLAYLFSLLVTPVHFASGLLGVVVAGFAIAAQREPERPAPASRATLARQVLAVALALACVGYGGWRMLGLTTGQVTGRDIAADAERVRAAARIIPGEPMNDRRVLEVALLLASTPGERDAARAAVDTAPGYITGYTPNLVQFAALGMLRATQLGSDDVAWERSLLERAAEKAPDLPSLAAEELHLAVIAGDVDALPALIERAERLGQTYPFTERYLEQARELVPR